MTKIKRQIVRVKLSKSDSTKVEPRAKEVKPKRTKKFGLHHRT